MQKKNLKNIMTDPEAPTWAQKIANYHLEFQCKGLMHTVLCFLFKLWS